MGYDMIDRDLGDPIFAELETHILSALNHRNLATWISSAMKTTEYYW